MRKTAMIVLLALAMAGPLMTVAPGRAAADTRCSGGPGVQVYEDINFGGRSWIVCYYTFPIADFTSHTENLSGWDTWNDRISSYQTFNFSNRQVTFWWDQNYGYYHLSTCDTDSVSDRRNWGFNDVISSAKYFDPKQTCN
jgi:hypothetical protein